MSYILEALKKAEKERKRGTIPNLSTDQDHSPQKPEKRPLWPYILIVALLLNAGFFLFWFSPWESQETTIVAKSPAVGTHDFPATSPKEESSDIKTHKASVSMHPVKTTPSGTHADKENGSHALQSTITAQKPTEIREQQQTAQILTTKEEDEEVPDRSSNLLQSQEHADPSSTTFSSPSTEPTTSDKQDPSPLPPPEPFRLYDLKSLPASVKEDLPDINISVFVYSDDPSSRVVKINGQTVREGQELTDGLKVEKIVPEGVIFNYEDYRFRVKIR